MLPYSDSSQIINFALQHFALEEVLNKYQALINRQFWNCEYAADHMMTERRERRWKIRIDFFLFFYE